MKEKEEKWKWMGKVMWSKDNRGFKIKKHRKKITEIYGIKNEMYLLKLILSLLLLYYFYCGREWENKNPNSGKVKWTEYN